METVDVSLASVRTRGATSSPLIIALDDDLASLETLRAEFVQCHSRFSGFTTITDAVRCCMQKRIDSLIVQISKDSADNLEYIKQIRKVHRDVAIVLTSTFEDRTAAMDIISSGEAHYYLLKPFRQEDVAALARHITAQQSELRNQKLAMTLSTFTGLPVPQRFQNRLTYLLSKPNVPLHEIIGEIEKNPGLLAKILRIANSMHYWTRSPIVSLREAIIFIGIEYLETLVMASDVFENIMKSARRDVRNMYETLWNSSLRRAVIAKRIAEKSGMRKETSTIHVAALLQDIGLLARLCLEPDAYMKMVLFAEEQHVSLYAAEMRIFTTTHDELGGGLLKRWNFPHEVVFAITNHHCEIFGDKITEIVQLSDALDVSGRAEPHDEGILPHINIWKEEFEGMFVEDQTQSH